MFDTTTNLTSDVKATGSITIDGSVNVTSNRYSFIAGGAFTNMGQIDTGHSPNPAGSQNGNSFPSSYGGSGGGGNSGGGTNGNWCGGSTTVSGGCHGAAGQNATQPSLSNPNIQSWYSSGMVYYLSGAGGGNAQACNIYQQPGQGAYGLYVQANTIVAGTINAAGSSGVGSSCFDGSGAYTGANTGGGGGGTVVLAYHSGSAPSISGVTVNGGSGTYTYNVMVCPNGCWASGHGGSGYALVYQWNTPPVPA